jgi:hypothetical protein
MTGPSVGDRVLLERADFPKFLSSIQGMGYKVVGPTVRDNVIVLGDIKQESDLPIGWTDKQAPGKYRIEKRKDNALFGYNVGPHSWKKYLYLSRERLWTLNKDGKSFKITPEPTDGPKMAFLGMRACELAALSIHDKVFDSAVIDAAYHARRSRTLRIAVQCSQAGQTCFCASMGTGPGVKGNHDLALTEICSGKRHSFVIEVGTPAGAAVLAKVPTRPAPPADAKAVTDQANEVSGKMGRKLDTNGIRELLQSNLDHPRWEEVSKRCLLCANCTMSCPTCFCSTTEEIPDLAGKTSERWRRWDSCFNLQFTELLGKSVRKSPVSRYRQWHTHKLAGWKDQFGTLGCVGCGRCITWCPVGIDITEEAAAIRASPGKVQQSGVKT